MSTPLPSGPLHFPRVKFVWGGREVIEARWRFGLFGFYTRIHGFPGSGLAISGRGLLRWALGLGLAGYLAVAAVLARVFARDAFNRVGFTDVLLWPARRDHVAELRGRAWLARGKAAMQDQRWAEGVFLLRRGLERCPDDFDGRLTLAQFHLLTGERTRAFAVLTDGPTHGRPPRAYLQTTFEVAAVGEDWTSALLLCDRTLPQLREPAQWGERQWLLGRKLEALIALGRAEEALALAVAEGDAAAFSVKEQRARALLALHRPAEAAAFLAAWRATVTANNQPPILRLEAPAWREAGRFDEMERALAGLRSLNPTQPDSLAFAVEQCARASRGAAAALEDYLFRFGKTPAALQLVATPLAEIPDVTLTQRVAAAAAERGFTTRPFNVKVVEATLRHGDRAEFARLLVALAPQFLHADAAGQAWLGFMQRVAAALGSDAPAARDGLVAYVRERPLALAAHRLALGALQRAGRLETARDFVAETCRLYPESPTARAQRTEIERALAAAPRVAPIAIAMRAAAPADWETFVQAVDAQIADARWPEAWEQIQVARFARPAPTWLDAHDAELQWRELRVHHGRRDTPALRVAARVYLNGSAERGTAVLGLARDWRKAGAGDDALLLVKTVIEKMPDEAAARALLDEWEPRTKR